MDRELDAEVAVQLFGWARRTTELNDEQAITVPPDWTDLRAARWWGHDVNELVPHYSTDIAAAWSVVDHMQGRQFADLSIAWDIRDDKWCWVARFGRVEATAYTAPEAICRAALAAVGQGVADG